MAGPGRPTLYKPDYAGQARTYCLLGATNDELAGRFGVSPRTVDGWIATIPEFADAVRQSRDVADAEVVGKVHAAATGFTVETTRSVLYRGEVKSLPHTLYFPPNIRAAIFWLRNRRPEQWREKPEPPRQEGPSISELEAASERVRLAALEAVTDE